MKLNVVTIKTEKEKKIKKWRGKEKKVFLSRKENVRQTIRKKKRKKSNQVKEKVLTNSEVTGIFIHIAIKLSGKK